MTPHPDTASPSTSFLDALKKMHGKEKEKKEEKQTRCHTRRKLIPAFVYTDCRRALSELTRVG